MRGGVERRTCKFRTGLVPLNGKTQFCEHAVEARLERTRFAGALRSAMRTETRAHSSIDSTPDWGAPDPRGRAGTRLHGQQALEERAVSHERDPQVFG